MKRTQRQQSRNNCRPSLEMAVSMIKQQEYLLNLQQPLVDRSIAQARRIANAANKVAAENARLKLEVEHLTKDLKRARRNTLTGVIESMIFCAAEDIKGKIGLRKVVKDE